MPFLLTVRLAADDGHQTPIRQARVTAYALKQPVVLKSDGSQIVHQPETALTDDTGHATLTLYRSSEVLTSSDWAVTIDGVTWSGPVPESPGTASSILEMVESHGWGIIAAPKSVPVVAVTGPSGTAGPPGPTGPAGPDIDGLSSDLARGIDVVGNVAAASETLTGTDATHIVGTDKAAAGQTANIREVRDNTGQVLIKVDAHGNIVPVALDPPVAPALGTATAGDITGAGFQWGLTLVNAQGETTLGTKTLATDLTAQQQSLTIPPTAPDGCSFNLYRNKTGGSEWDKVTTGLAPGAIYIDDTLDGALGSPVPTANGTAPNVGAPGIFGLSYFGNGDNSNSIAPDEFGANVPIPVDYSTNLVGDLLDWTSGDTATLTTPGWYQGIMAAYADSDFSGFSGSVHVGWTLTGAQHVRGAGLVSWFPKVATAGWGPVVFEVVEGVPVQIGAVVAIGAGGPTGPWGFDAEIHRIA